MIPSARPTALAAAAALLAACGGSSHPPPDVVARPSDGHLYDVAALGGFLGEPLVLEFASGMTRAAVQLGGTLVDAPVESSWSARAAPDDTLTLRPAAPGTWAEGTARTLHVEGTTSGGRTVTADLTLDVASLTPRLDLMPAPPTLAAAEPVVVSLDFEADPATLVLSGDLLAAPHQLGWSADRRRLTLQPSPGWSVGAGRGLTLQVSGVHSAAVAAQGSFSYDVTPAAACGVVGGACVDATDCTFTVTQLESWTVECFSHNLDDPRGTASCVEANLVTAGCAGCASDFAFCAKAPCFNACAFGFTTGSCVTCLAGTSCPTDFATCSGRPL